MKLDNTIVSEEKSSRKRKLEKIFAYDGEYRKFVSEKIKKIGKNAAFEKWVEDNKENLLSVYLVNLDPVREKLQELYSTKECGHRPCDPQVIVRRCF